MKIKNAKQLTMAGLLILMGGTNSDACCMCKYFPTWSTWLVKPKDVDKGAKHITDKQALEMIALNKKTKLDAAPGSITNGGLKTTKSTFWTSTLGQGG